MYSSCINRPAYGAENEQVDCTFPSLKQVLNLGDRCDKIITLTKYNFPFSPHIPHLSTTQYTTPPSPHLSIGQKAICIKVLLIGTGLN